MKYYIGKILCKLMKLLGHCLAVYMIKQIKRGNVQMATSTSSTTKTVVTNALAIALAYLANKASDDNTSWTQYRTAIVQSSLSSILSALTTSTTSTTTSA